MSKTTLPRVSGILLHPTSFPSPYGIGDMGYEAYEFIDFLHKAGQHLWQILPLTPTGFGDSPYQSFSAFAGQPLIISPALLRDMGLVREDELYGCPTGDGRYVEYGAILPWKTRILKTAFYRFWENPRQEWLEEYEAFTTDNASWLDDYALFTACKEKHQGQNWLTWDEEYRNPTPETKEKMTEEFADGIKYCKFVQFLSFYITFINIGITHIFFFR